MALTLSHSALGGLGFRLGFRGSLNPGLHLDRTAAACCADSLAVCAACQCSRRDTGYA